MKISKKLKKILSFKIFLYPYITASKLRKYIGKDPPIHINISFNCFEKGPSLDISLLFYVPTSMT